MQVAFNCIMKLKTLFFIPCLTGMGVIAQFGPRQLIYEHPISGGRMIRTADFDNDGDQDAVITIFDFIAWYPNDGDGNFGEPNTIELDMGGLFNLLPVDLDRDGNIDLVVSYFEEDKIVWYQNLGGGSFSSLKLITSGLNNVSGVTGEDIDNDGDMDLVLGVTNGSGLYWVENLDGQGDFGVLRGIDANLGQARRQRLGDMDGDGDIDIVSNGNNPWLLWFENVDGEGDFSMQHIIEAQGLYENAFDIEDLDGDGDLDIVSEKNDDLIWRENLDGLGNFGPIIIIESQVDNIIDIHIADLDNDGFLDVLSALTGIAELAWYKNTDGLGTFGPKQLIEIELFGPASVYTADLDNDGDLDVLTSTVHPDEIGSYWFENLTILDVNENYFINDISIFPNPTQDILHITTKNNIVINQVQIIDLIGKLILSEKRNVHQLNVSHLKSGVFIIKIETEQGNFISKLMKK
jgi:hypothetical protein